MFNEYPYRNLTDLNLDYILNAIKTFQNDVTNFVSINAIKYANPIQWDITRQYEKNTIVIDPITGTAYISVAPVPSGVALTREEYWTVVFDLSEFIVKAAKNFTNHYEESTTLTATFPSNVGDWLVWNDTLYKALVNITAGDRYVIGSNIEHFTMEQLIGHIDDLNTTDKTNLIAAINEVLQTLNDTAGDLTNLNTTDKTNLVNAINEVLSTFSTIIGDLADLTTADKTSVVNAINEVNAAITQEISNRTDADNAIIEMHKKTTRNIYNIKENGGDNTGVNDISTLVNDAISNGYNSIYFPKGVYLIANQINVNVDDVDLFGDGSESVLLIDCNNAIYIDGYYIDMHDLTFKPNNNGYTAIDIYDSYDNFTNLYFKESTYYFDTCVNVGHSDHISWFCKFDNIRINDSRTNNIRGAGIRFTQAVNTMLGNSFISDKEFAITINASRDLNLFNEGLHFDNINIVWCNYALFVGKALALFIDNIIADQIINGCITLYNSTDVAISKCSLAPAPSSDHSFQDFVVNSCWYVMISETVFNANNNEYELAIFSSGFVSVINSAFLNTTNAITLADNDNQSTWFNDLRFTNVTNQLVLRGANKNNSYGKLFGDGGIVLNDVSEQRATTYTANQFVNLSNVGANYTDVTYSIGDTVETGALYNVNAFIVDEGGMPAPLNVRYMRSLSTANSLVFRISSLDGNNISDCWFSLSIQYYMK